MSARRLIVPLILSLALWAAIVGLMIGPAWLTQAVAAGAVLVVLASLIRRGGRG